MCPKITAIQKECHRRGLDIDIYRLTGGDQSLYYTTCNKGWSQCSCGWKCFIL